METKLTTEELQDQLYIIEEKQKELKEDILYQKFSELTFFQTWKICNNWKKFALNCILFDVLIFALNDNGKLQMLWFMLILPFLFFLSSLSNALEIRNSIVIIKKKRTN